MKNNKGIKVCLYQAEVLIFNHLLEVCCLSLNDTHKGIATTVKNSVLTNGTRMLRSNFWGQNHLRGKSELYQ